jgi:hypothetical protein
MEPTLRKTHVNLIIQEVSGLSHNEEEKLRCASKMNRKRERKKNIQSDQPA